MIKSRSLAFAAIAATLGLVAAAVPAGAAPEPTGWDNIPDVIIGGGSDTSYNVMSDIMPLYNGAPGCLPVRSSSSAAKGTCDPSQLPVAPTNGNHDHDIVVNAFPTGSGAGVCIIAASASCPQYNPPIQFARSSRGPSGTELANATFWGFARDGIALLSFGGRPAGNIGTSAADAANVLFDIYTCAITDWSQIPGYTGAAGPIIPWGMNASAGTFTTFRDFVRGNAARPGVATFDPNTSGTACVRQLVGNVQPEENDAKPILADAGPDGVANTADDDDTKFFWWGSFAEFSAFSFKRSTGQFFSVASITPQPSSLSTTGAGQYPLNRLIYHVTRNTDADLVAPGPEVTGADSGPGGAVREFTEWLCKGTAQHGVNPNTGQNYRAAITGAFAANGMVPIPTSLRTPGYQCAVLT
jgi:ABC-type phosphate transport system substrate-binding protein